MAVTKPRKLRIYTMTSDSGLAPHVKDGWMSLACCAGPVRNDTEKGDFVLGISGKTMDNVPKHVPIYLMKIDEKMTFDKYFHDQRFVNRVDNIYRKNKNGRYIQDRGNIKYRRYKVLHKDEDDTKKSEFVLLSKNFYYFGDNWKSDRKLHRKTEKLCNKLDYSYTAGGHYRMVTSDLKEVDNFLSFIENNYKPGKIGEPNNPPDNTYRSKCY